MPGRGRAAREVPEKRKTREKVDVFRNLTNPLGGADRGGWEAEGAREEMDGNRRKQGKRALSSAEQTSSGHTWGRPAQPFSSARSAKHGATQAEEKRERADLSHGCTERIRSAFGTVRPTNKHEPDGSRTE